MSAHFRWKKSGGAKKAKKQKKLNKNLTQANPLITLSQTEKNIEIFVAWAGMYICMYALFFGVGETPCKKSADLRPKQGNLLHRNNCIEVYKTYPHSTK
jgi:hypothetical protein